MPRIDKLKKKSKKPTLKVAKSKPTPSLITKPKKTKNMADYYRCLANNHSQKKITACCSDCKKKSATLANLRKQEISKIQNS
jgi:hypothetical protein